MKKSLLILCVLFTLVACTKSKQSNAAITSTIEDNNSRYTPKELDSLVQYAWGDVKFGMSLEEAKNSVVFYNGTYSKRELKSRSQYENALKNGLHIHKPIKFSAEFLREKNILIKVRGEATYSNYKTEVSHTLRSS